MTAGDIAAARARGDVVKLIASATREPDGSVRASVLATPVPEGSPFGRTGGVLNRIEVRRRRS